MIERKETCDELMQDCRSLKLEDFVDEKDYRGLCLCNPGIIILFVGWDARYEKERLVTVAVHVF